MTYQLSIRIDLAGGGRIGPGKVALLEAIQRLGSISAAGREMKMSYRRAWQLVESMNGQFAEPVVASVVGGPGGGGARLTKAGEAVVSRYRAVERVATLKAAVHLKALDKIAEGAEVP